MPSTDHADFLLRNYAFNLPPDHIAHYPSPDRSASRLMVLNRPDGSLHTSVFNELTRFLPEKCLLVTNNSKVIPARIRGTRGHGGKVEFLLLTPIPLLTPLPIDEDAFFPSWSRATAEMLVRPVRKMRVGELVSIGDDLAIELLEKGAYGRCLVNIVWRGALTEVLGRHGTIPLPPYIHRQQSEACPVADSRSDVPRGWGTDAERYQTIYANPDKAGSAAAPTAGLHFTPQLRDALLASGREWAEVTLYVGYGTFSPVREADIRDHQMHAEYAELPESAAKAVNRAKAEGRAVIAVGTTCCRVLEGMHQVQHTGHTCAEPYGDLVAQETWLTTFMYPGKSFQVIDGLITNFHLPESSLLMLVAAFAGRERILAAYQKAIDERFRFFSYGDAMLIM